MTVLKDTATQLDFRVTTLEENGGSGNSSIAELEVRVETLEVTVSDQETRLDGILYYETLEVIHVKLYSKQNV